MTLLSFLGFSLFYGYCCYKLGRSSGIKSVRTILEEASTLLARNKLHQEKAEKMHAEIEIMLRKEYEHRNP